uniref:Short-chain dehydrogenase n=1 Tax=Rhizophora mucronata TaxID=61149 RepID=A0A2P2K9H1_RHIMU
MLSFETLGFNVMTPALLMSRFRGMPKEMNSDANFLTEAIELRSNSITSILAEGISLRNASFTSLPALTFLTAMTTWTPRNARTRAVSRPMPLVAPVTMAVRPVPSIPPVTSSAVELLENPDGLFQPNIHSIFTFPNRN